MLLLNISLIQKVSGLNLGMSNLCSCMFTLGLYFKNLGLTKTNVFLNRGLQNFVIWAVWFLQSYRYNYEILPIFIIEASNQNKAGHCIKLCEFLKQLI